jgi:hypothetical protein
MYFKCGEDVEKHEISWIPRKKLFYKEDGMANAELEGKFWYVRK